MEWLLELKSRNISLFYFGSFDFILAIIFVVLSKTTQIEVMGVNAWFKPIKFALSIGIFSWTMGWLMFDLPQGRDIQIINWLIIIMLGFEIIYISFQAAKGQLSHFNLSTPLYSGLYSLMAIAATVVSFIALYIGIRFIQHDFPNLPDYYVMAIRIGLFLFFIFALEGFVMGSSLSHTIGGPDGGEGLLFLNWSRKFGDPRVAHFIGMHALQILPLMAYYVLKNVKLTIGLSVLYAFLAIYVLLQALQGKPFLRFLG